MAEQMTREEAIQFLTMQRDLADDAKTKLEFRNIMSKAGEAVGYTPAFRCLVNGLSPEDSIRWGK